MYSGAGYKPEFFHDRRWHAVKTQVVGAEAVDMPRLVWRQHCRHAELGMTAVAPETPNYTDPEETPLGSTCAIVSQALLSLNACCRFLTLA